MTELPINPTPRWYLAPLYSRGRYSPRLNMAWLCLLMMFRVIEKWLAAKGGISAGVFIPPPSITEVLGILAGMVVALLGLGTLQKVALDKPTDTTTDSNPPGSGQGV
jgi:hypothetical protein